MVRFLVVACIAVASLAGCGGSGEEKKAKVVIDDQLRYYVQAQEALARDNFDEAGRSLLLMWEHTQEPLNKKVYQAAKAADIADMRQIFVDISAAMDVKALPAGYSLAYCPMANENKGAHWVQKEGEITNPYYGSSMLRCGTLKESM